MNNSTDIYCICGTLIDQVSIDSSKFVTNNFQRTFPTYMLSQGKKGNEIINWKTQTISPLLIILRWSTYYWMRNGLWFEVWSSMHFGAVFYSYSVALCDFRKWNVVLYPGNGEGRNNKKQWMAQWSKSMRFFLTTEFHLPFRLVHFLLCVSVGLVIHGVRCYSIWGRAHKTLDPTVEPKERWRGSKWQ